MLTAIHNVTGVVANAVGSTVAVQLWRCQISADLFGCGPEVVDRILRIGQNGAIRYENAIDADTLARVGQVERVIESCGVFRIGKPIEIPVCLSNQYGRSTVPQRRVCLHGRLT